MNLFIIGPFQILTSILVLVIIGIYILYLYHIKQTLEAIQPENRRVQPNSVWLMLIPIFNLVYPFILYPRVSDSLQAEYLHRGWHKKGDFSRSLGISMAILGIIGLLPIGGLSALTGIINLVLWITYWTKIGEFKTQLLKPY